MFLLFAYAKISFCRVLSTFYSITHATSFVNRCGSTIWATGSVLKIRTDRPQQLQVITFAGSTVILRDISAGDTSIDTLLPGLYIVILGDGMTKKVMIR